MRILILNTDYGRFLRAFYTENPGLEDASYARQMALRNQTLFGSVDFYSRNFRAHGHDAEEVHVNNRWIQYAWAREHGVAVAAPPSPLSDSVDETRPPDLKAHLKSLVRPLVRPLLRRVRPYRLSDWENAVLTAQVEAFKPDIILNQEISYIDNRTLRGFKAGGIRVMGQLASPLGENDEYDAYDLIISSLPNLVAHFRNRGVAAEFNQLAFEPYVLDALGPAPARDVDLSFVGSLSPIHARRIALLEFIARRAPLKVWGNQIELLDPASPLHACYQGEAWGRDMFNVLRRSRITLNKHIDMAEDWANNMRLYEATGMGAMLLTDAKHNLAEIFKPGAEVAAYLGEEDCVAQIHRYLADEPARAAIAAAGQRHTIQSQTYYNRTGEILKLIHKHGLVK